MDYLILAAINGCLGGLVGGRPGAVIGMLVGFAVVGCYDLPQKLKAKKRPEIKRRTARGKWGKRYTRPPFSIDSDES